MKSDEGAGSFAAKWAGRSVGTEDLHQHSVGTKVTEIIREMIYAGQLTGGQRVPQDDIARDLGVSRLPVREAVASLELDGLLRVEKHRGAFVQPVRRTDVEDHYRIFGQTHGLAAARAAASGSAEDIDALRAVDKKLRSASELDEQHQLNWEFHRVINVIGGSRRLQSIVLGLTRQIPRSFRFEVPPATRQALREHKAILDAIVGGDSDAAFDACVAHLGTEASYIITLLEGRGFFDEQDK